MTSLYRKWRSRSFDDLIGQDHVVRTLRNAVRQGRIHHAYLFTGPRGTGKTSTARILAKAVNCRNPQEGNPCGVCEACRAADEGRALDVIEIDAASNTSVDNVRELRERVAYAAGEGQFKVYIVDEVHRLSGAAFDAFLKTLEEPPPHVIFVFASTEPHKVPATIASRCQRFDFRRIGQVETLSRLHYVAAEESIQATEGALKLIAHSARGSLRDALGLLDQATAYAEGEISEENIRHTLGLADPALVARLTHALLYGEVGSGLQEALEFAAAGGDPLQLLDQLISYWRALLLVVTGAPVAEADADPELESQLREHAAQLDRRRVLLVLRALGGDQFSAKYSVEASLVLEMAYVEAALALESGPSPARERPVVYAAASEPEARSVRPRPEPAARARAEAAPPSGGEALAPKGEPPKLESSAPEPSADKPGSPAISQNGDALDDVDRAWERILESVRARNKGLEAVLKSGYLLSAEKGEVVVGFLYDFHYNKVAEPKNRRILEEAISQVLGSPYRVQSVRASREEIEAARGSGFIEDDDGFVEEVAERLRQFHAREISGTKT